MATEVPDLLPGYLAETLPLAPEDGERPVATLVRWASPPADPRGAVLYVHGYNDYFFQPEHGPRCAAEGLAFFALDLRRCGRSLRPGELPSFTVDLLRSFEELDAALRRIRGARGHARVLLFGHSTGALLAALYAHHRREAGLVDALLLDAPFFDFRAPTPTRWLLKTVVPWIGRVDPRRVLQRPDDPLYAWSLHRRYGQGGRWDYDEAWKRPGNLPLRAGWLAAVRRGHRAVKRGLAIPVPILTLHSARSGGGPGWNPSYLDSDAVLLVEKMAFYTPRLGPRARAEAVEGALHDVFLSRPEVAERAWRRAFRWLGEAWGEPGPGGR